MRSNPIYLAGCFSIFLLISACAKQTKEDRANPAELPSTVSARLAASPDGELLHQFLQKNGPAFEAYTIDGSDGGEFVSKSGKLYTIRRNSLVRADGSTPSGPVTIFLKEISTPANMIFADRQTASSSGEPLVSYGEFFVRAQEAGKDLQLSPDSGVIVQAPARQIAAEKIPMWNGDTTVTASLSGYNYQNQYTTVSTEVSANKGIDWDAVTNPGSAYAFFDGSTGTLNFRLDSLIKWVNCDLLMSNPNPKTTVLVYFKNNYNPETDASYTGEEPTMLFFKPSGINSVIKFYNTIFKAPVGFEGFLSYQNSIPIGQPGTFLAISSINGVFYADQLDVTIAAPATGLNYTTITLDPQPVSASALVSLINSMNTK